MPLHWWVLHQGWSYLFLLRCVVHLFFSSALASFCLSWHTNCAERHLCVDVKSWRQRAVLFIICILEHLLEKTMQTDGWKTFQHNVILLKKHDCYQKQFMHTNFFLVDKKITSAFILIPLKQNCLQKEKTNTRHSFRTNLLKDSKGKINEVEWTDFVLLFTSDVLQVEQKWFKLVVIAIIYRLQWSPKVWCHIWDVYH